MKLAKLSLAAIVALGVSAFADVENVKFSGDAKLYYGTNDADQWSGVLINKHTPKDSSLFGPNNSYGQAALDLAMTADLADDVKGKLKLTVLSTLGLENNLVSDIWAGAATNTNTQWWMSEAWLAKTFANTTVKVGRQELDTPLAFSEKWNIAENTFDAAVILNKDIPQTTLVAAWIGRGNGIAGAVVNGAETWNDPFQTYGSAIQNAYGLQGANGAYAIAAVTKAIPMTTAQVWYYNVIDIATAWWLQADVDLKDVAPGLTFGLQYAYLDPDKYVDNKVGQTVDESKAWAVKVGYGFEGLKVSAAYSKTDDDGLVTIANTATGAAKGSQSKLYTDAWWNYGYVARPATSSWKISAEYSMEGIADFGAYYTNANQDTGKNTANPADMSEFTVTASKSFGNLDATLAYIYTDADDQNAGDGYNTVQVYLTYNF